MEDIRIRTRLKKLRHESTIMHSLDEQRECNRSFLGFRMLKGLTIYSQIY